MTLTYRDATPADAQGLAALAVATFLETFGHLYRREDIELFLGASSDPSYADELADRDHEVRFAEVHGMTIGFAKVSSQRLPLDLPGRRVVELRQLYVYKPWHGAGVAAALMEWALGRARARGAQDVILSVFTDNPRGRAFYKRYGFVEVQPYKFMVGNCADDDIICRLTLDG